MVGLSLIPAFGTLYQRLTLPESTRFISAQKLKHSDHADEAGDKIDELKKAQKADDSASDGTDQVDDTSAPPELLVKKKAHFGGVFFVIYSN